MEGVLCRSRPGSLERRVGKKRISIDELKRRYENGLDLWSGEPLEGEDADDWLRVGYEIPCPARVLSELEEHELLNVLSAFL